MIQDEKLLLIDLCARLPYGVKVKVPQLQNDVVFTLCGIDKDTYIVIKDNGSLYYIPTNVDVFPYLRPMSSMTEEEVDEFTQFDVYANGEYIMPNYKIIDWLNANHFDYRGLIPKGLALVAHEGMYK